MRLLIAGFVTFALAACAPSEQEIDNAVNTAEANATVPAPITAPAPDATIEPATNTASPAADAKLEADYLGRWVGVEGMYLNVAKAPKGGVMMEMQYDLDNKATVPGSVTAEGLRFMRNGVAETAVHTDGAATGLKYLAGKKDCLTVKSGEGYCRD